MTVIPTTNSSRLIKIGVAAAMLDMSVKTIRRMVNGGKIPVIRLGKSIRFDRQVLSCWINQGCPPVNRFDRNLCDGATSPGETVDTVETKN